MMFSLVLGQVGFESFGQFAAGQHDAPATAYAFQPNIRAKTDNIPFIGATRVLFAQAQLVIKAKVRKHGCWNFRDWDAVRTL
jgi:hypothetical protein